MAGAEDEFSFATKHLEPGIVMVEVTGHMDTESDSGKRYLSELRRLIDRTHAADARQVGLVFKDSLSGFVAGAAAKSHGELFRDLADRVLAVAIVSTKLRMRFGVAAAKLFAKQPIEIFIDESTARYWLRDRARDL
jgi:hypothetical protein